LLFVSRRILHITDSLGRTGVASQVLVLSRGLVEKGFDVHVAALEGGGALADDFHACGVSTTTLGRRWAFDPVAYVNLQRLMRRLRPDAVHTWNSDAGVFGRVAAWTSGVRNVVTGLYRIDPLRGYGARLIDRQLAGRTPRLVTSSVHVRDWWARCVGLPAEKFTVIRPGVQSARASDLSRDQLLRELQLPADARLIGVVGRLVPEKRVKDLIWAADLLRVLHDNLRLLIIGDGPLRTQLEQYARLASDLEHIQFLEERTDAWRIMPHFDALWNASENRGQSIAILEAMAAGVPVVASDTPMNREFVVEGETGYLIPLLERSGRADRARHTDRIFADRELAARLAENASRRVVELFNSERMAHTYADLYQAALR
jgi:glycosyltransferase involved in cell wall biosynthesis